VLTGRSSQFDKAVNSDWAFTGATGGGQVDAAAGPHAFACGSAPPEISLFATPPFDVPTSEGTDQIPCRAPNS
jgi:hypothetical protein